MQGNPGHRPLNRPKVEPLAGADCPDWLAEEAKREWARLYPELMRLGLLKQIDRATFTALCAAWADFVEASAIVAKEGLTTEGGNGTIVQHPAYIIKKASMQKIRELAAEFGLTPSARGRVHIAGSGDGGKNDDDFFGPRPIAPPPPPGTARPRPRRARKSRT